MTTETATIHPTEPMPTTYRIRLHTSDVEGVRRLARSESHRLGRDIHWTVLVRRALRKMSDEQVTIG